MLNTYAMYCDMELFLILHRSKDEHNKKLKQLLAEEVSLSKENVYSPLIIDSELSLLFRLPLFYHSMCLYNIYVSNTGAIQRYFESRRRSWREMTDPAQQKRVSLQNKRRKIRARKQRVCACIS